MSRDKEDKPTLNDLRPNLRQVVEDYLDILIVVNGQMNYDRAAELVKAAAMHDLTEALNALPDKIKRGLEVIVV